MGWADDGALAAPTVVAGPPVTKAPSGGGFFDGLKSLGGDLLSGLDLGRSALVSAGSELGDLGRNAVYGENNDVSLGHVWHNITNHLGAGDVIQQAFPDASPWIKDVAGGALDVAADPLNAVSFGSGEVAKEGLAKAGQVIGDTAAKDALHTGGLDALRSAVEEKLATIPNSAETSLEDVLKRGTGDLGKTTAEEHVANTLGELEKNAKGGLGFGGQRTGIGQGWADSAAAAMAGSPTAQAVSKLVNPVAKVAQATGSKQDAEIANQAIHTAAIARREARAGLADAVEHLTPEEYTGQIQQAIGQSIGDDLVHDAPGIASKSAKAGWAQLAGTDTFVHPAVADALAKSISVPPSEYVQAFDKVNSAVKQLTVFGPLNGVQHDAKRTLMNHLLAVMNGGATDPALWKESWAARTGVAKLVKAGEDVTAENLIKNGMDPQAAERAIGLYHDILGDNPLYEVAKDYGEGSAADAAKAGEKPKGILGTRHAQQFAEADGELSRGAVYLKGLDEGLSTSAAAAKSRSALMDFSSEGLTPFERDKLQRAVFFYKFPRRAIPNAVKFTIEHPGEALAASKVGLGAGMGARNKYGEVTGLQADTPLEAGLGGLAGIVRSPGNYVAQNLNPLLKGIIDSKHRGLGDLIPPIGQAQGKANSAFDTTGSNADESAPTNILSSFSGVPVAHVGSIPVPVPGFNHGTDYTQAASDKKKAALADKIKQGGHVSLLESLQSLADQHGVPNAFTLKQKDLVSLLQTMKVLPASGSTTDAVVSG